jgi:small conductance mechanosensitive channel
VDYGQDIDQARQVIETVIQADKRILETPAPYIAVSALADSSVNILVRVWVNTEDYWNVCHEMNRVVYDSFMKNGIDFPYPQQTIHIVKD